MSAKLNKIFFNTYIEADKLCCAKFGVERGGINEYINKLINSRFASDREDTLNRLTKYRDIRNVLAHEAGAMSADESLVRSDVKWMQGFTSDLHYKRPPFQIFAPRPRLSEIQKNSFRYRDTSYRGCFNIRLFQLFQIIKATTVYLRYGLRIIRGGEYPPSYFLLKEKTVSD